MGIDENAFLFVLASRGIKEKGWLEAIEAVKRANRLSERRIQLLLLGDGPMMEQAQAAADEDVFFGGVVHDVRNYFAMGDMGLLPSYFAGESYPLSVAECLSVGKPVMAAALAEIPNQISGANGEKAGILLDVEAQGIDEGAMADRMVEVAQDAALYEQLCRSAEGICGKFDLGAIVQKHFTIYQEVMRMDQKGMTC